jgi:hypothetical protein
MQGNVSSGDTGTSADEDSKVGRWVGGGGVVGKEGTVGKGTDEEETKKDEYGGEGRSDERGEAGG